MKKVLPIIFLSISTIWFGCEQETQIQNKRTGELSFDIIKKEIKDNGGGRLNSFDSVSKVVLTINNSDGDNTQYKFAEINLYSIGDEYISEKIVLEAGSYIISDFFLIDNSGEILYATPNEDSPQSQNVNHPLPVPFNVTKDEITEVLIEVIPTEDLTPGDFGLAGFEITQIEVFSFLVTVSEEGNLKELLSSTISVISDDFYLFHQDLGAISNNVVTLKDGMSDYTIEIHQDGYLPFIDTFSSDSLKKHESFPLSIELKKIDSLSIGLIAHYPFNNNAEDISGNGFHGIANGANLTTDRHGNQNSSYSFDGNDYIDLQNSILPSDASDWSLSVWINSNNINSTNHAVIFGQYSEGGSPVGFDRFHLFELSGFWQYFYGNSTVDQLIPFENHQNSSWKHITITCNNSEITTYFDSEVVSEGIAIGALPNVNSLVGFDGWIEKNRYYSGKIDDIRIYNRALSSNDVDALFQE